MLKKQRIYTKRRQEGDRRFRAFLVALAALVGFQLAILSTIGAPDVSSLIPSTARWPWSSLSRLERIETLAIKAARKHQLEPELIWAVIAVESNFDPEARSAAGAIGLMQIMPATAEFLSVEDPWDQEQNINAGSKYLKSLLRKFKGNTRKALAAYNAGPGAVKRHKGIPPYPQTRNYVKRVMARYNEERAKSGSLES